MSKSRDHIDSPAPDGDLSPSQRQPLPDDKVAESLSRVTKQFVKDTDGKEHTLVSFSSDANALTRHDAESYSLIDKAGKLCPANTDPRRLRPMGEIVKNSAMLQQHALKTLVAAMGAMDVAFDQNAGQYRAIPDHKSRLKAIEMMWKLGEAMGGGMGGRRGGGGSDSGDGDLGDGTMSPEDFLSSSEAKIADMEGVLARAKIARAEVLAQRDFYINAAARDLTGAHFGDPPRGFSALDRRGA